MKIMMKSTEESTMSYKTFSELMYQLSANGKTSGPEQTEERIISTLLNVQRMSRIEERTILSPLMRDALRSITVPQTWYVITEAWCCDSAHNLPVIARMAAAAYGKVELRIILRDENPEFMELHQTNNSMPLPKLICFDEDGTKLFEWGGRPEAAQQLFTDWKTNPQNRSWGDFKLDLFRWYSRDNGITLQREFLHLLKGIDARAEGFRNR